jgi:hypothetical protein
MPAKKPAAKKRIRITVGRNKLGQFTSPRPKLKKNLKKR